MRIDEDFHDVYCKVERELGCLCWSELDKMAHPGDVRDLCGMWGDTMKYLYFVVFNKNKTLGDFFEKSYIYRNRVAKCLIEDIE
ncbi:hypothetical protein HN903_01565 [archaeon]|jgi:hypothetical protein|nr:hypothetical protein [archaeon]MBT7128420.1 hypothetical protein [archaeon]